MLVELPVAKCDIERTRCTHIFLTVTKVDFDGTGGTDDNHAMNLRRSIEVESQLARIRDCFLGVVEDRAWQGLFFSILLRGRWTFTYA
jgi:hypothetical protein